MKKRRIIQPILWTKRTTGAVMGPGSLWPSSAGSSCASAGSTWNVKQRWETLWCGECIHSAEQWLRSGTGSSVMTGQNDDHDNAYGQIVFKLLGNPPNDVNTRPR
jgi:hypothetical protein